MAGERSLREMGIPAVSIRKYREAGIITPDEILGIPPLAIAARTGITPDTVSRHADMVARYMGRPAPAKVTRAQVERGRTELLALRGMNEALVERLHLAGVHNAETMASADPPVLSERLGIPVEKVKGWVESARQKRKKKRSNDIIEL